MFNSETLEIGIGMAFLFLLMSLICTGIKEWIEGLLKWRAMDLERALRTVLDDESGQLTTHLFSHPLISSLFQGQYDCSKLTTNGMMSWIPGVAKARQMAWKDRRHLPSYIPAAQFAAALIDLVGRGPASVDSESAPHMPLTIELLRERAAALASPFLRRALLSAIDHSQGDLKQLTENLQRWFDGSMDRASGWYKRRTQTVLFVLGVGAAAVLNVDALYVMERLTSDKTFRETVVSAAAKAEAPAAPASAAVSPLETAKAARRMLDDIGMPMGWLQDVANQDGTTSALKPVQLCKADGLPSCNASKYAPWRVPLGWLMTAFAVMLGAPFWFDVLNKFMVIRSTVKPREKSREEGSEDRAEAQSKDGQAAPAAPPPAAPAPGAPPTLLRTGAADSASPPPQAFVPNEWRAGVANPKEVSL